VSQPMTWAGIRFSGVIGGVWAVTCQEPPAMYLVCVLFVSLFVNFVSHSTEEAIDGHGKSIQGIVPPQ
jgi:hypothetical protein